MYLNAWAHNDWRGEQGLRALCSDFAIEPEDVAGIEVLLASYTYEDYSGDAFVLFRLNGQLFEVNGSHCSCYGLEGQWEPEPTSVEALKQYLKAIDGNRYSSHNPYVAELKGVVEQLEKEAS